MPMLLYKYFCPYKEHNIAGKIVRDVLGRLLIRFTQPVKFNFNDPFDCRPEFRGYEDPNFINQKVVGGIAKLLETRRMDIDKLTQEQKTQIEDARKQMVQKYASNPEILENVHLDSLIKKLGAEIGILCLSEQPDNIRMWSHYAENHTGFIVGFETETEFFRKRRPYELGDIGELRKVTYSAKRPIVHVPYTETSPHVNYLFTKYNKWRDEKERRILRFLSDAAESKDGVYLFSIPPNTIQEIIFGNHAGETTEPSIEPTLDIMRANHALSHVKIKKARLARNGYAIDIVDFPIK
jgi:Protein of unknown function (DUF2971)